MAKEKNQKKQKGHPNPDSEQDQRFHCSRYGAYNHISHKRGL